MKTPPFRIAAKNKWTRLLRFSRDRLPCRGSGSGSSYHDPDLSGPIGDVVTIG